MCRDGALLGAVRVVSLISFVAYRMCRVLKQISIRISLWIVLFQWFSLSSNMSSPKIPRCSDETNEQALAFLKALSESGKLQELLAQVPYVKEDGAATSGSMNDSSKRRFEATNPEGEPFIPIESLVMGESHTSKGYNQQLPVSPSSATMGSNDVVLPAGIRSVEHWSETLCELPKVQHYKMTYAQLVANASDQQEIRGYLQWALTYKGSSARTHDLADYLRASGYTRKSGVCYSNGEERKFGK